MATNFNLALLQGDALMAQETAGSAIAAGTGAAFGSSVKIYHSDIAAGDVGAAAIPSGRAAYRGLKDTAADVIAAGDELWLASGGGVQTTATAAVGFLGYAIAASAGGATHVDFQHSHRAGA